MIKQDKGIVKNLISGIKGINKSYYKPVLYNLNLDSELKDFEALITSNKNHLKIANSLENQLLELYLTRHPDRQISKSERVEWLEEWKKKNDIYSYGTWVYYPWSDVISHILPANEFIELRTSRNKYKISEDEQGSLGEKIVGVIGLSVGQSVALTMAIERVFGTIRIADFDHLDLSNLNRIRSGLSNISMPKTILVAREIAEIDPYLKIELYNEGITKENIADFIGEGESKLDLLIEECDSLDIKILARAEARKQSVPVLMDTSDRGMLDVERFDLEPKRPLMHGMVSDDAAANIDKWSAKERLAMVMDMVGVEHISPRLKASLLEVEQSLKTWPQLASSVALGGAITTIAARRILLKEPIASGRHYIDIDEILNPEDQKTSVPSEELKPAALSFSECEAMVDNLKKSRQDQALILATEVIDDIVEQACWAPSGGNVQPWKWIYKDGILSLFHDIHYSYSFLDFKNRGSLIGLGAALENVVQRATYHGLKAEIDILAKDLEDRFIAQIQFYKGGKELKNEFSDLGSDLNSRLTNRLKSKEIKPISEALKSKISLHLKGSEFSVKWLEGEKLKKMAQIVGAVERQRILDPWGHDDFIAEARWTKEEAESTRNGVDLRTLDLNESDLVGFKLIKDAEAIAHLRNWDKGKALIKMSTDSLENSSALALVYTNNHSAASVLKGGRIVERLWVYLNKMGLSYQPVSPATFMFARLRMADASSSPYLVQELSKLRKEYLDLLELPEGVNDLFLARLFYADEPAVKSLRKPLDKVFKIMS